MAYYDFPHTRNYDSDLGFLISEFEELLKKYGIVEETLDDIINRIDNIINRINAIVIEEINNSLADGKIFLKTEYNAENKKLKFIFNDDSSKK